MCFSESVSAVEEEGVERRLLLVYNGLGGIVGKLVTGAYDESFELQPERGCGGFYLFYSASGCFVSFAADVACLGIEL